MSLAQKKLISIGFLLAALLAAIFAKGEVLDKLWIALVLLGLALNLILVRCPHCGCMLGRYSGEFCVMCGEKIDWHEKNHKKNPTTGKGAEEDLDEVFDEEFDEKLADGETVEEIEE